MEWAVRIFPCFSCSLLFALICKNESNKTCVIFLLLSLIPNMLKYEILNSSEIAQTRFYTCALESMADY